MFLYFDLDEKKLQQEDKLEKLINVSILSIKYIIHDADVKIKNTEDHVHGVEAVTRVV